MTLTGGQLREKHVVEFEEGRLIAWRPAEPGQKAPGHLWRWVVDPADSSSARATHTYDWTQLADASRIPRARATTTDRASGVTRPTRGSGRASVTEHSPRRLRHSRHHSGERARHVAELPAVHRASRSA